MHVSVETVEAHSLPASDMPMPIWGREALLAAVYPFRPGYNTNLLSLASISSTAPHATLASGDVGPCALEASRAAWIAAVASGRRVVLEEDADEEEDEAISNCQAR
jgi:hypothetical protein